MKYHYNKWFEYEGKNPYIEEERKDFTHVRQSYEEDVLPKTLVCKECGTNKFIVGQCSYMTIIKCEKCEYEICVHSG